MFGSISKKAEKIVSKQIKSNKYLSNHKPSLVNAFFHNLFKNISLLLLFLITIGSVVHFFYSPYLDSYISDILNKNYDVFNLHANIIIGSQTTIIAVIIPITIALVSVFVQSSAGGFSNAHPKIRVYLYESNSVGLAASSFTLLLVIILYYFYFERLIGAMSFESPNALRYEVIWLFTGWFLFNLIATWYFVQTSILFINPNQQLTLFKTNLARSALSESLRATISTNYLYHASENNLIPHKIFNTGISYIYSYNEPDYEVTLTLDSPKEVVDIYLFTFKMAIFIWSIRCVFYSFFKKQQPRKIHMQVNLGRYIRNNSKIFLINGGIKPNMLEILLLKLSIKSRYVK